MDIVSSAIACRSTNSDVRGRQGATFRIAQVVPREPPAIEVADVFADELLAKLAALAEPLSEACLSETDVEGDMSTAREMVTNALAELSSSFVVLHEAFHILAGHLRELEQSNPSINCKLDEFSLGMDTSSPPTMNPEMSDLQRAYYREFEADNNALQAMIQLPMPPATELVLVQASDTEPEMAPILARQELLAKIIGFRILAAASWIVIRLVERQRAPALQRSHPLPGARLLAAFITLVEEYAGLSQAKRQTDEIRLPIKPSKEQKRLVLEFTELVLKPVLVHLTASNGDESIPLPIYVKEIYNLMFNQPMETPEGNEVLEIQSLRTEMVERLSPFRYI